MTRLLAYTSISIFAAALLSVGCGGDDDSSEGDTGEGGATLTGGTQNTGGVSVPGSGGTGGSGTSTGGQATSGGETGGSGTSTGGQATSGGGTAGSGTSTGGQATGGEGPVGGATSTGGQATGGEGTGGEGTGGEGTAGEGAGGEGIAGEGAGGEGIAGEGAGGEGTAGEGAGGAPPGGAAGEGPGGEGGSPEGGAGAAPPGGAGGAGGVPAGEAGAGGQGPEGTTLVITDLEDASITDGNPDSNLGDAESLIVDGQDGDNNDGSTGALIRLADGALAAVPAGATIVSAELVLYQLDPGDDIEVYLVTEAWSQGAVTFTDAPATGTLLTTLSGNNTDAEVRIDITNEVIDWIDSGDAFGVLLAPTGTDGNDFNSTEASAPADELPRLVIVYTE